MPSRDRLRVVLHRAAGLALAGSMACCVMLAPPLSAPAAAQGGGQAFTGLGSASREPIRIDADRLDVFDREDRAVYAGNVVAVQGDTTIRCSRLTIHFVRSRENAGSGGAQAAAAGGGDSAIERIECEGPVTIVSRDQVASGERAIYDRVAGQVILTGNVALSQGQNVTRGERLVYDVDRGIANVEAGGNQRVRGLFVPSGGR